MFEDLQPAIVWQHFATLCRIPRQSKQEGPLRSHLEQWAQQQSLQTVVDTAGNLIIRKPASAGYEASPGVPVAGRMAWKVVMPDHWPPGRRRGGPLPDRPADVAAFEVERHSKFRT